MGWESHGAEGLPVVVVMGGISAGRHAASGPLDGARGWWEDFIGEGCAIDPADYRVLAFDFLGGAGASTGPDSFAGSVAEPFAGPLTFASDDAAPESVATTGCRHFPAITPADQAHALARVLDALGIATLHAVIGSSYGAMVAVAFAAQFPERAERLVAISGAHRTHPMATAVRTIQRRILRHGIATGTEGEAVVLARALAMTTYRSADEFRERFGGDPAWDDQDAGWASFPVEQYLLARGGAFQDRFPTQVFLTLSESLDLHRVDPAGIRAAVTLVTVEGDPIAPTWQAEELAEQVSSDVRAFTLRSRFGHDAFLKEPGLLQPLITGALARRTGRLSGAHSVGAVTLPAHPRPIVVERGGVR